MQSARQRTVASISGLREGEDGVPSGDTLGDCSDSVERTGGTTRLQGLREFLTGWRRVWMERSGLEHFLGFNTLTVRSGHVLRSRKS